MPLVILSKCAPDDKKRNTTAMGPLVNVKTLLLPIIKKTKSAARLKRKATIWLEVSDEMNKPMLIYMAPKSKAPT